MSEIAFAKQFLTALDSRPIKLSSDHVEDPKKYPAQPAYILPRMPKPFHRPSPSSNTPAAPSSISVSLHSLSSSSGVALDERLSDQALATSIHDLKTHVAQKTGYETSKVKILFSKKPCADSKTLKELLPTEGTVPEVLEFSVMLMGQPASKPAAGPSSTEFGPGIESTSEREETTPAGHAVEPQAGSDTSLSGPSEAAAAPSTKEFEMTPAGKPAELHAAEGAAEVGTSGDQVMKTDQFWSDLRGFLVQRLRNEQVGEEASAVFRAAWMGRGKLDVQMTDA